MTDEEKKIRKIRNKAKRSMESLGIWKPEFLPVVDAYAKLRYQYENIYDSWEEHGSVVVEEYTNKAGATNMRKSAEYTVLEIMRKDILTYENTLGLTPVGLKKINQGALKRAKGSRLAEGIKAIE